MFGKISVGGTGSGLTLSKALGGISKALNIANQALPIYQQAKPIFHNAKGTFGVLKNILSANDDDKINVDVKKDINVKNNTQTKDTVSYIKNSNNPVFFQ